MSEGNQIAEMYHGRYGSRVNHDLTRRRVHWICRQVTGQQVLDVGCSQGIVSLLLAREGFDVLGIDVNADAIDYAERARTKESEATRGRLRYLLTPGGFDDIEGDFDTIIMGELIEHLVQPTRLIEAVLPLLKPEGRLVLTTPLGVHLAPDHKDPMRPSVIRDLLTHHFRLEAWERFDHSGSEYQYLGLSLVVSNDATRNAQTFGEPMLALAEKGLISTQLKLVAARERLKDRQATVDSLRRQLEDSRPHVQELEQLSKEVAALRADLDVHSLSARNEMAGLRAELDRVRAVSRRKRGLVAPISRMPDGRVADALDGLRAILRPARWLRRRASRRRD